MSGTSLDGIDAAAARIEGRGYGLRARLIDHRRDGLGELGTALRGAAAQAPVTSGELAGLALALGRRYAEVIGPLAVRRRPDLIAAHGQTIVHRPPVSWQLLNAAPIAERLGCPVVSNLRQGDLARGGQGAPITPIADWVLFARDGCRRAVVNLGGYCNVTLLGPRTDGARPGASGPAVEGFDVCACNQVLDGVARRALGVPYDEGGRSAASGRPDPRAAAVLSAVLEEQRRSGRSLGTGDEASGWVSAFAGRLAPADLAASAVEAVARCIAGALVPHGPDEVILAGGSARNAALLQALHRHADLPCMTSDTLGVPVEAREALAMAVLGALLADGAPITPPFRELSAGPRRRRPCGGSWTYPRGDGPCT